jgi:hypothetical protein
VLQVKLNRFSDKLLGWSEPLDGVHQDARQGDV